MEKKKKKPYCSTTRLPVLEGRNQPALKIDMRSERNHAVVEGEHAGRGGRWQLVVWISASQTGPTAILHPPCLVQPCQTQLACPVQQWVISAAQKGHLNPAAGHS